MGIAVEGTKEDALGAGGETALRASSIFSLDPRDRVRGVEAEERASIGFSVLISDGDDWSD